MNRTTRAQCSNARRIPILPGPDNTGPDTIDDAEAELEAARAALADDITDWTGHAEGSA